jgi:hypothetical protein
MKLFIGNSTKQNREIHYRLPGERPKQVHDVLRIPPGGQVQFPGDHARVVLDEIVNTQLKYGFKEASSLSRNHSYVGLIYSFDKKITENLLSYTIESNDSKLDEMAKAEMQRFASANLASIDAQPRGEPQLRQIDVCVEDTPSATDLNDDRPLTADGMEIRRDAAPPRARRRG